jgi:hypothetical protein
MQEVKKVNGMSAVELCQKLKDESEASQDDDAVNDLRIRILDYLITSRIPDDRFEEILEGRINDPDPTKDYSKTICGEILEAWRNEH